MTEDTNPMGSIHVSERAIASIAFMPLANRMVWWVWHTKA